MCFTHKNWTMVQTSLWGQASSAVNTVHQPMPWIESDRLSHHLLCITPNNAISYLKIKWLTLKLQAMESSLLNMPCTPHLIIQNYQRDSLNIIYSSNIITLLYMFWVSSTHLQEDTVVHKQHMVPSLSIRVLVSCWYAAIVLPIAAYQQDTRTLMESDGTICCLCTTMSSWRWVLDTQNM